MATKSGDRRSQPRSPDPFDEGATEAVSDFVRSLSDKELQEKIERLMSLHSGNAASFPDLREKIRLLVLQLNEEQERRRDKEIQDKIERLSSFLSGNGFSSLPDKGKKIRVQVEQLKEEQERRRKKPVRVLSEGRAMGDKVETPREVREILAQLNEQVAGEAPMNKDNTIEDISFLVSQNHSTLEACDLEIDGAVQGTGSNKKQKTKKTKDDDVVILMESFKSVVEALKESTAQLVKSNQRLQIPENEIWSHLEELQLHEDVMYDAYLYLTANPPKLGAFLGCPIQSRKIILSKMLRNSKIAS